MADSTKFIQQFRDGTRAVVEGFQLADTQVKRWENNGATATAELITPFFVAQPQPPPFEFAGADILSAGAAIIALRAWMHTAQAGLGNRTPYQVFSKLV